MPSIAPLVLTNGTTDTTFSPRGKGPDGTVTYVSSNGVPLGDVRLTIQKSRTATNGREKVSVKLVKPTVATAIVNGVENPAIIRTAYFDGTFTFDKASTVAERQGLRRWLQDLFGETNPMGGVIDDLDALY